MFVHESNILNKIDKNYNSIKKELLEFYNNVYLDVKKSLIQCNFSNKVEFEAAVKIIDEYLDVLEAFIVNYKITSQSKLRSTFLEELSVYLTKDFNLIKSGVLGIYNKKIYSGLKIKSDLKVDLLYKDVDFCIGKKVLITVEDRTLDVIIPIISVEVKTYLDGTMYNEVMYSATQIKNSTPDAKILVLMETNQVGVEKIRSTKNRIEIDEMFVLKKNTGDPLSFEVLYD